jgi:hypothetical protein
MRNVKCKTKFGKPEWKSYLDGRMIVKWILEKLGVKLCMEYRVYWWGFSP